ncbi:hypothetical protein [Gordonia paraffinivorans]|uniref:hypothetical protein n=1 Tax=Gordonia paraffinivorans TaxID=175628 RepID=UPI003FCCA0E6
MTRSTRWPSPRMAEQITRDHPSYRDVVEILLGYPELRLPARPARLRVPDERVWLEGRSLLVEVWQIGPDGDLVLDGDEAVVEPDLVTVPID